MHAAAARCSEVLRPALRSALHTSSPPRPRRLFPGRGLLVGLSDYLMDRLIPQPASFRQVAPPPPPTTAHPAGAGAADGGGGGRCKGAAVAAPAGQGSETEAEEALDDVVSGREAAEAALPSADPASGPHPHAPSAPAAADRPPLTGALLPSTAPGGLRAPLPAAKRAALRAALNTRYADAVEPGEVEAMHALLGSEHIFRCLVA